MLRAVFLVLLLMPQLLFAEENLKIKGESKELSDKEVSDESLEEEKTYASPWQDLDSQSLSDLKGRVLLSVEPVLCSSCDFSLKPEAAERFAEEAKLLGIQLFKTSFLDRPELTALRDFSTTPTFIFYDAFPVHTEIFRESVSIDEIQEALNSSISAVKNYNRLSDAKQKSLLLTSYQQSVNSASKDLALRRLYEGSPVVELAFARASAGSRPDVEYLKRTLARGDTALTRMQPSDLQQIAGPVIKSYSRGYRVFNNPRYLRIAINTFRTVVEPVLAVNDCNAAGIITHTQKLNLTSSLIELYWATGNSRILEAAGQLTSCLERSLNSESLLARDSSSTVFLIDNALLGNIYLDFYASTLDVDWIERAEVLGAVLQGISAKADSPVYIAPDLILGDALIDLQPVYANSALAVFYQRLAAYKDEAKFRMASQKIIENIHSDSSVHFENVGAAFLLSEHLSEIPTLKLSLKGSREDPVLQELHLSALKFDAFSKVIRYVEGDEVKSSVLVKVDGLKSDPIIDADEMGMTANSFLARQGLKKAAG